MVLQSVYDEAEGTVISVFKGNELREVGWLEQLFHMINDAFATGQKELNPGNTRFKVPTEVAEALGETGICAVAFKDGHKDIPVATAALKPWKGVHVGFEDNVIVGLNESLQKSGVFAVDWELSSVAVSSQFSKQGLASRCINVLEQQLQQTMQNNAIQLWIVATYLVENYWKNCGYTEVASTVAPKGTWCAVKPFRLVVMKRSLRK
jgi:GNAT superfamily N-acetyltransferase